MLDNITVAVAVAVVVAVAALELVDPHLLRVEGGPDGDAARLQGKAFRGVGGRGRGWGRGQKRKVKISKL